MVSVTDTLSSNGQWKGLHYTSEFTGLRGSTSNNNYTVNPSKVKVHHHGSKGNFEPESNLPLFEAIKNQRYRQALLLIQSGQDVNGRNESGETPLMYISKIFNRKELKKVRTKFSKLLLDFGGNPNEQDPRGTTILMQAANRGQEDIVQTILANDETDITIQDKEGNTGLMHAARHGYLPVIQAFIEHFIKHELDPNLLRQRNNQGKNALEIAKEEGKPEVVHTLTNYLTQFNSLYAKDLERWASIRPTMPKARSLDSISVDSDATYVQTMGTKHPMARRKPGENGGGLGESLRDSQSDGANFEAALRRKIESLKSNRSLGTDRPDYYEEIWEQETMSWFSGDKDSVKENNYSREKSGKNNRSEDDALKLPPIGSNRLIDYKTWCEMGGRLKKSLSESLPS